MKVARKRLKNNFLSNKEVLKYALKKNLGDYSGILGNFSQNIDHSPPITVVWYFHLSTLHQAEGVKICINHGQLNMAPTWGAAEYFPLEFELILVRRSLWVALMKWNNPRMHILHYSVIPGMAEVAENWENMLCEASFGFWLDLSIGPDTHFLVASIHKNSKIPNQTN